MKMLSLLLFGMLLMIPLVSAQVSIGEEEPKETFTGWLFNSIKSIWEYFFNGIVTDTSLTNPLVNQASAMQLSLPIKTEYHYEVYLTGNESKIYSEPRLINNNNGTYTLYLKQNNITERTEELCEIDKDDKITCKEVTYDIPINLDIKDYSQNKISNIVVSLSTTTQIDSKTGVTKEILSYTFNDGIDYVKLGDNSITIIQVPFFTYNANVTNVSQEFKMAHIEPSTVSPYNSLLLYLPFDDNYSYIAGEQTSYNNLTCSGSASITDVIKSCDNDYNTFEYTTNFDPVASYQNYSNVNEYSRMFLQWRANSDDDGGGASDQVKGFCYNYATRGWVEIFSHNGGGSITTANASINPNCIYGNNTLQFKYNLSSDFDSARLYETTLYYYPYNKTYDYSNRSDSYGSGTHDLDMIGNSLYTDSGVYGGAYKFEGDENRYLKMSHVPSYDFWFNLSYDYSISMWVKPSTVAEGQVNYAVMIGKGAYSGGGWYINLDMSTNKDGINFVENTIITACTTCLSMGNWNHVIVTANRTSKKGSIYVNGVYDTDSNPDRNSLSGYTGDFIIGRYSSTGNAFRGSIDEVMIFNKTLGLSEVQAIFNNQSSRFKQQATLVFNNTNISEFGNENRTNITVKNYQNYFNTNISVSINGGSEVNISSNGQANDIIFSGNPNYANITFKFLTDTNKFYSPLIANSITFKSWTAGGEAPPSDTEYPIFSNYWDNNGTVYYNNSNYFNVSISNTNATAFIEINGVNYSLSNTTSTLFNRTTNITYNGTFVYYFGAWGNGSSHNYNISEIRYYTVNNTPIVVADSEYPIFFNFKENPTDPNEYNPATLYRFNSTINSTNNTVGIEFNGINYSLSNISNVYNSTIPNLAVGVYNYYYWAYGNGSSHKYNISSTYTYTVIKNSSYILGLSVTSPITYGTSSDFTGSNCPTQLTCSLNLTNQVFGAGTINANYSTNGNANYSTYSTTASLTINKATSEVYTYIDGDRADKSVTNGTSVTLNTSLITGSGIIYLYINDSLWNSDSSSITNTSQFNNTGSYVISGLYNGNDNYTSNWENWTLTVNIDTPTPPSNASVISATTCKYKKFGYYNLKLPWFREVSCI